MTHNFEISSEYPPVRSQNTGKMCEECSKFDVVLMSSLLTSDTLFFF